MADKLEQVAIRMVEQPPLYSKEPMNNPDAAIRVMNEFLSQIDRELFCIVNLQADLTPINMNIVSVGSLNEALINPREIFKSAILSNAHSMMLIHNHPSGNLTPSTSDIQTTARMQELGELMGISLVDHIITGRDGNYYSFRDKGEFPDSKIRFSTRVEDIDLTKGMVAEAIAPCVLWVDELEKAFAGMGADGGHEVTTRLFGTFLTWMQEKTSAAFVVATANDITKLPPELLRKGRFDEIFFVGLPTSEERRKIFEIHIAKRRKQDMAKIKLSDLVSKTEGYSGADIEGVVKEAVECAFADGKDAVTTEDILAAIKNTNSLSVIMKEPLEKMKKEYEQRKLKNASR